jgi:hypothetical protein
MLAIQARAFGQRRRFRTPGVDRPTGAALWVDIGELCPLFGQAPKRSHLFTLRATKISA